MKCFDAIDRLPSDVFVLAVAALLLAVVLTERFTTRRS